MTHYTNLHTFTVNTKNLYRKKQHFGTILCFRRFSEHSTKCKLGLNYAKLYKMFLTLSTISNEILELIVEIRCWTFFTNFIPKYHCGMFPLVIIFRIRFEILVHCARVLTNIKNVNFHLSGWTSPTPLAIRPVHPPIQMKIANFWQTNKLLKVA